MRIRILALAAGAVLLAACSGDTGTGGSSGSTGTTSGGCTIDNLAACSCTENADCAGLGDLWFCDTEQTKTCLFQCNSAQDCTGAEAPPDVSTACSGSKLGCTCDFDASSQLSQCNTKGCGTDADCPGGNVCQSGQCVSSQVASVNKCAVFPEFVALNAGGSQTFTVQAYQDSTPVKVTDADVTWAVAGGAPLTNSGATFTVNSGATATATTAAVQATIHGTVVCTANVQVYPANSSGVRVTVLDALAGVPLQGATVVLDSDNATTDEDGIATFDAADTGSAHTVSVFDADFDFVTLVNTSATDILIPVARNADANIGGVTGTVNNLFQANSKIHAAFVGMSIPGSITDLSLTLLEGPSEPLNASIGGKSFSLNVPAGVMLGLNDNNFKDHYKALGAAGWCADANGNEDTTRVKAGTCGTRGVWGLAGDIDLDKISPLIDQISGSGSLDTLNIGGILGSLLPVLRNFNSVVQRDQAITLGPADTASGIPANTPTTDNLKPVDLDNTPNQKNAVKLSLAMKVKVPQLPHYPAPSSTTFADGAIVLAGSDVPGRGLFPLGLTAGLDNDGTNTAPKDVDGHVSFLDSNQQQVKDIVNLNMAPAHHGTESGTYRLAILASSFTNLTSGLVGSGIVLSPGACQNGTGGICYGSTIDVSGTPFMAFPADSSFDYASRTLALGTHDPATTLARLDFHDAADHRWFVYFDPADGDVTVPAPQGGFDDRTRSDDTATGPRSTLLALDLELSNGATADDAYTFGGTDASLLKLDKYISRFVIKDYPSPSISISAPNAGTTLTAGSGSVTVAIAGDDANSNAWKLCVTSSATPLTTGDLGSAACSPGGTLTDGSATATIPAGSPTGSAYIHAVLTNSAGDAVLNPTVEAAEQITVQ